MTIENFEKAKKLNELISDFDKALNCFEVNLENDSTKEPAIFDLKPRLIIEFDDCDDGRDQIPLPMNLSNVLIDLIKSQLIEGKEKALAEFNNL